jgi:hypothetical protein
MPSSCRNCLHTPATWGLALGGTQGQPHQHIVTVLTWGYYL